MADTTVDNRQIVPYEKRVGISICIISRGQMPSLWFQHIVEKVTKRIPSGVFWNFIIQIGSPETTGDNYASLRNKCVEEALRRGSKWVFFIDDDVFVPETVIGKMIKHSQTGMKIVSGLYYKKTDEVEPVIFKRLGDGPYFNYPVNEVFEIEGSGAGCLWIDTSVFDKFREAGIPYFKQDWLMQLDHGDGKKAGINVEIGEDHWLFYQAKKLGVLSYCDSELTCDHYCSRRNKMFPQTSEVYRVRGIDLNSKERLKPEMEKFKKSTKPKILFVVPTGLSFNGMALQQKPLGGSETAVIHTAKGLAKNNSVMIMGNVDNEGVYDDVIYLQLNKMDLLNQVELDIVAMVRNHTMIVEDEFRKRLKAKEYWLWMQDYPMYHGFENFLRTKGKVDRYICVSNDHKNALLSRFPYQLEDEKIVVIENGVDTSLYNSREKIKKVPNQFYYSSTPYRGLEQLIDVWPKIKERVPDSILKICSSMRVYGDSAGDKRYGELYKKCRETPGVEYVGSVKQEELAKVAMESYGMLYPCTFAETNCLVGNTKIKVPGGHKLLSEIKKGDLVYSYSHDKGRIVISKVKKKWKTKDNAPVYKLKYKWGIGTKANKEGEIIGTRDHLVMMKNGSYKPLGDLKENERLMPFYRGKEKTYTTISLNNGERTYEHDFIMNELYGCEIEKGKKVVHHKDGDTHNNNPKNLHYQSQSKHASEHLSVISKEIRKKQGRRLSEKIQRNPEIKEKWSNAQKERWKNMSDKQKKEFCKYRESKRTEQGNVNRRIQLMNYNKKRREERMRNALDEQTLRKLYIERMLSPNRIANELNTNYSNVCYFLSEYDVPLRSRSEAQLVKQNHKVMSVEFHGYEDVYDMEVEDTHNFVANDVFVHNCISVEESQTAGTPIVCNDLGAIKETVHKGCGVVVPGDPRKKEWKGKYVDAVVNLCEDEALWKKLHKNCLQQNFDWSVSVKKWKKQIKEMEARHTGEPSIGMAPPWNNSETLLISDSTTLTGTN